TITGRSLTGVVGSDAVSLSGGSATFADAGAGTGKTVTGTGFTLGGADAGNYVLASTTLTTTADINKAALTVTADDESRGDGDANPGFTATYSGFVNGEPLDPSGVTGSPDLTTTATATSAVGPYTITAAAGSLAAGNYSFSFVNGTLAVTKATLTIKADD